MLAFAQPLVGAEQARFDLLALTDVDHRADGAARPSMLVVQRHRAGDGVARRRAVAQQLEFHRRHRLARGGRALQRLRVARQRLAAVAYLHGLRRTGRAEQLRHRRVVQHLAALRVHREREAERAAREQRFELVGFLLQPVARDFVLRLRGEQRVAQQRDLVHRNRCQRRRGTARGELVQRLGNAAREQQRQRHAEQQAAGSGADGSEDREPVLGIDRRRRHADADAPAGGQHALPGAVHRPLVARLGAREA